MNRRAWDQIVSGAGAVIAVVLIVLGALAVYGGRFGQDNVQDRLAPQNITIPSADALSPEEAEAVGEHAGAAVDTGPEALAFSNYIGVHLSEVNEGKTYAETSAAAREEGLDPDTAAELQGKADTLFKGEALRSILLNAYGWWTVATIAMWAGIAMIVAGLILGVLAILGFRHAARADTILVTRSSMAPSGVEVVRDDG
jgi:hypothetical protein